MDATPSRPHSTRRAALDDDPVVLPGRSPVGKIIAAVVVLAVLGGAGFLLVRAWKGAEARAKHARAELTLAKRANREAKRLQAETSTKLASREADLVPLRALEAEIAPTRLPADQAATILTSLREALAEAGQAASESGRVTLVVPEGSLFEAGKAELTDDGSTVLGRLGKALAAFPATEVRVQAHTGDRRPRDKKAFPSNWELSSARALAVVHHLEDESDIDGKRLAVVGLGQYRPRSLERAENPRIEMVVAPLPPAPTLTAAPAAAAAPRGSGRAPRRAPRQSPGNSGLGPL